MRIIRKNEHEDWKDFCPKVSVAADACLTATKEQHEAALNAMRLIADVATVDMVLFGFE